MKQLFLFLILIGTVYSCSGDSVEIPVSNTTPPVDNQGWLIPVGVCRFVPKSNGLTFGMNLFL
ncbi:MAG: hypothetical protein GY908_05615 [Flavobacteriales bacterium]|nr:hypothetical protein [Flavobacteriales bacterium]